MISAFPSPILSVAADVVKDLEGEDALCSLWTLFTKCKESLKDGRRLENISWRLWYRELAAAQTTPSSSPGSLSPPFSEKRSPSPITPVSEDGHLSQQVPLPHPSLTPTSDISTAHSWHAQNSANTVITAGRRLSTASAPMERRKSHSSIGVGKMILDILPAKLDVNSERKKAARPTRPTPTAATIASVPQIAQPRPMVATLPTVQLPATPPDPERASFPRVVVVNPTPHPTPPATPSVPHPPSTAATAAAQPSSHLLPPPPARSLISATAPRHRKPPSPPRRPKHAGPATTTKSGSSPRLQQQEQPQTSSSLTSKQQPTSSSPAGSHDAIPTLPTRVGAGAADPNPKPRSKYNDDTLKASDRRFFLPDSGGSPSPERPPSATSDLSDLLQVESPTVPSPTAEQEEQGRDQDESELKEADRDHPLQEQAPEHAQSPSSATSSQLKGPTSAAGAGGAGGRKRQQVQVRKNKERGHAPARPAALQRLHSHGLRTTSAKKGHAHAGQVGQPPHTADAKKTTFNIGSVSSNGSGEGRSTGLSSKVAEKEKDVGKEKEVKEKEKEKETREKETGKGKEKEKEKGERRRDASSSRSRRPSSPPPNPPKKSMSTPLLPAATAVPPTTTAATTKANGAGPSQPRRGIVISTSSEYDTTDTDDDSEWASEDSSEGREKDKSRKAKAAEDARLREAAEEAKRQRDMFAKVPKRSYSNLNRVQSGLLSQLLNPDPNLFPPNHPYRSTQDMTQLARAPASALQMQMRKSTAAVPLAAQVQVTAQAPAPTPAQQQQRQQSENGRGYRKGRPEEEVEFSSDDDENPDDTIQVSRSLAQQKLAALADPNRRRHSDRALPPSGLQMSRQMQNGMEGGRPQLPSIATAPIPLSHPYNLPAPAPPMTPRATRRQMLQTELSESLRRNLLWERQVSRVNLTGRRAGTLGSALRPLTAVNGDPAVQQQQQAQGSGQQAQVPDDKEEKRRRAMARNRSWADEYHYSGW
ncbi:hypothetical protein V8D89_007089 [Ganoderma adspersum]